uniref:Uncharacterized protein n=1 Tax=Ascaris lumbricoides TaxID=6252 RepID=A0A0M3IDH6_ASCLU
LNAAARANQSCFRIRNRSTGSTGTFQATTTTILWRRKALSLEYHSTKWNDC